MANRSIEETFKAVKPKGRKGIPNPPTIGVGVTSNNSDLATSLSQAGQQIAQLQAAYQQQASLITANTQAIQGNTSAQSGHSALSTAGGVASSLLGGGGLGLLSPLISGIASLFGGSSAPAPLPIYTPPPPVAISATLQGRRQARSKRRDRQRRRQPATRRGSEQPATAPRWRRKGHGERERHGQPVVYGPQHRYRQRRARGDVEHAPDQRRSGEPVIPWPSSRY